MTTDTAEPVAITWGLLGPDSLPNQRRMRALELGAAVRHYNDLAVPGMGGVWFGRQLLWPTLGLVVAEQVRQARHAASNIEVANAVEALACWLVLQDEPARRDRRLRGTIKLQGVDGPSFNRLGRSGAYVSQPMRMAAVQPLRALGLVEGNSERFSAYTVSGAGHEFVRAACAEFEPVGYSLKVPDYLQRWVEGEVAEANRRGKLFDALSPLQPLPSAAIAVLRDRLVSGDPKSVARRRAALDWVAQVHEGGGVDDWDAPAPPVFEPRHWHDLRLGAAFFTARDRAMDALDCAERAIGPERVPLDLKTALPEPLEDALQTAAKAATHWLGLADRAGEHPDAVNFCQALTTDTPAQRLRALVERDGRVLQLRGDTVVPAAAFEGDGKAPTDDEDDPASKGDDQALRWPEGLSYRLRNLHRLHLDMLGRLDAWLHPQEPS